MRSKLYKTILVISLFLCVAESRAQDKATNDTLKNDTPLITVYCNLLGNVSPLFNAQNPEKLKGGFAANMGLVYSFSSKWKLDLHYALLAYKPFLQFMDDGNPPYATRIFLISPVYTLSTPIKRMQIDIMAHLGLAKTECPLVYNSTDNSYFLHDKNVQTLSPVFGSGTRIKYDISKRLGVFYQADVYFIKSTFPTSSTFVDKYGQKNFNTLSETKMNFGSLSQSFGVYINLIKAKQK